MADIILIMFLCRGNLEDISQSFERNMTSSACIECVKTKHVTNGNDIEKGDHIIFFGKHYDHHAIVISVEPSDSEPGNNSKRKITIIHASNTISGVVRGVVHCQSKAKILKSTEERDFNESRIMVVKYQHRPHSSEEIVQRAIDAYEMYGKDEHFRYHLKRNNCEHFATWCVLDTNVSIQVKKLIMVKKLAFLRGWRSLSIEWVRNKALHAYGLLCKSCFNRNQRLCTVPKRKIYSPGDVSVGDVITYVYKYLHHDAVVTEVKEIKPKEIIVKIYHYAFCGPLHYRTIQEDTLCILLDGSVTVFDYADTAFSVFEPFEVISRARSRNGEQKFTFFSNDSSHFARWCKLRNLQ